MEQKGFSGSLTIGPVSAEPGLSERQHLQGLIDSLLEENRPVLAFHVSRELADKRYGESYLDDFGIPACVQT